MLGLMIALAAVSLVLLATFGAALRGRRWPRSLPHGFRCKVATDPGSDRRVGARWPRRTSHGVWVNDVLLVYGGFWCSRTRPFHVHFAEDMYTTSRENVTKLGPAPVVLPVELDDGHRMLVAGSRGSEELLAGPFCAAVLRRRIRPQSTR